MSIGSDLQRGRTLAPGGNRVRRGGHSLGRRAVSAVRVAAYWGCRFRGSADELGARLVQGISARQDRVAQVADMIDLEGTLLVEVDWEPADGVTTPELAATWCRLEIQVGQDHVTAVEDGRNASIRRGIYTSAYPLAEWFAENWWLLRAHVRPSGTASSDWRWSNVTRHA